MTGFYPVVGNSGARSSIDDLALPFISAFNTTEFDYNEGIYQTKATACLFVKSKTTEIDCSPPSHVFNGGDWGISKAYPQSRELHSYVWFKQFPLNISVNRMRQIVAREGLDYLYKKVHGDKYPIVAARVVLFDWSRNQPISDIELHHDKCYSQKGFYNQIIDKFAMDQLHLPYGSSSSVNHQNIQYLYNNDNRMDIATLAPDGLRQLLHDYSIDIKSIVSDVFEKTHFHLKYKLKNQSDLYQYLNNRLGMYVISPQFESDVVGYALYNLQNNKPWRNRFVNTDNPYSMIKNLVYFVVNNYLDNQILA